MGNTLASGMEVNGETQSYEYGYENNKLVEVTLPTGAIEKVKSDNLERTSKMSLQGADNTIILNKEINYLQTAEGTTNLVASEYNNGIRTKYVYDDKGNITEINKDGEITASFEYDELNRLVKDNETEYEYDNNGNILYKKTADKIIKYRYNGDRLKFYNNEYCGEYDALGNPHIYRGKPATWAFRNLKSYKGLTFDYNASGLRTKKTNGSKETEYTWVGNKLLSEKKHIEHADLHVGDYLYVGETYYTTLEKIRIDYMYGISGITGFTLTNFMGTKSYYFQKNILGDVEKIYNQHNELVAEYSYDAFGNCTILKNVNNMATLNAIRYRSYYWDNDLKMYYLQSRWYDAEVGRFINADAIEILDKSKDFANGINLYAYCFNNPVNDFDPTGSWSWKAFWNVVVATVTVVAVAAVVAFTAGTAAVAIAAAAGASFTTAAAIGGAVFIGATVGGIIAGGVEIVGQGIEKGFENINLGSVVTKTIGGSIGGALIGAVPYVSVAIGTSLLIGNGIVGSLTSLIHGKIEGHDQQTIVGSMIISFISNVTFGVVAAGILKTFIGLDKVPFPIK